MLLFAGAELAQLVKPSLNGLTAVDFVFSAEATDLPGAVRLDLQAWPERRSMRTAQVAAARLPQGAPLAYRPNQSGERWTTFSFEPIADSAGQTYMLVLTYPDGPDVPGKRVGALARFPSLYLPNGLLVNTFEQNGNLLFRLAAAGTRGGAVQAGLRNLARAQPLGTGSVAGPAVALAVCALCAGGVFAVSRSP